MAQVDPITQLACALGIPSAPVSRTGSAQFPPPDFIEIMWQNPVQAGNSRAKSMICVIDFFEK
jgi:hypothetical protein